MINQNETSVEASHDQQAQLGALGVATGSVVFDGHIDNHPTHRAIYDLMVEIEKLPASEQQTKVVTMAGALQNHIAVMREEAERHTKCLRRWSAECFPAEANGQKHFARVLMEGVAEDLEAIFNPQNPPVQPRP